MVYNIPFVDKDGIPTGKRLVLPEKAFELYGRPKTIREIPYEHIPDTL